ncbi:cytosolic 5'-nucleotidase IIIB [Rhodnius prolixus]
MVQLEIPELNKENVRMKDKDTVLKKIEKIIFEGKQKLQIITDFDRTVSKHHHNGETTKSSYCIFETIPTLPKEFTDGAQSLYNKFRNIEDNPKMTVEEKIPYMEQWWDLNEKLFIGIPYNEKEVAQAIVESKVTLRDGTDSAFLRLYLSEIPVLVFSAGLGNVVSATLNHYNIKYSNVHVISNFFKMEKGIITGFEGTLLHVFNKNQYAIENCDYFKELAPRENVILMGDSLGDASMAEGVQGNGCILKIGFLSVHIDQFLPQYLEKFDIVLLDDQTMNVFNAILNKIL